MYSVDVPEVGSREQQKISSLVPRPAKQSSFKLSGVYKVLKPSLLDANGSRTC